MGLAGAGRDSGGAGWRGVGSDGTSVGRDCRSCVHVCAVLASRHASRMLMLAFEGLHSCRSFERSVTWSDRPSGPLAGWSDGTVGSVWVCVGLSGSAPFERSVSYLIRTHRSYFFDVTGCNEKRTHETFPFSIDYDENCTGLGHLAGRDGLLGGCPSAARPHSDNVLNLTGFCCQPSECGHHA